MVHLKAGPSPATQCPTQGVRFSHCYCWGPIWSLKEWKNNLKFTAQLFSDSGLKSFEYEMKGKTSEAVNIGKSVGEELLKLAGSEFKKK